VGQIRPKYFVDDQSNWRQSEKKWFRIRTSFNLEIKCITNCTDDSRCQERHRRSCGQLQIWSKFSFCRHLDKGFCFPQIARRGLHRQGTLKYIWINIINENGYRKNKMLLRDPVIMTVGLIWYQHLVWKVFKFRVG